VHERDDGRTFATSGETKGGQVFIQVIQGNVDDPTHLRRQMEVWRKELKPGATGYLGSTGGVTADGRAITLVRFESEDLARANAQRPEQSAWWNETAKAFTGEVTFHDCRETETMLGGGSNDAGFVQVFQARAKDQAAMRARRAEIEGRLKELRPDVLGGIVGWHGDGTFTQAVYFTSQDAARKGEQAMANDELGKELPSMVEGEPTFWDLTDPDLD
jgi:hypothetical protein